MRFLSTNLRTTKSRNVAKQYKNINKEVNKYEEVK